MIYGILLTFFIIACLALILLVLIQKGKGSMGLGSMGGGTTMLFGGSGGQDFFQKITWVLGAILMGGSLILGLIKSSSLHDVKYISLKSPEEDTTPAGEALAPKTAEEKQSSPSTAQTAQPVSEQSAATTPNQPAGPVQQKTSS